MSPLTRSVLMRVLITFIISMVFGFVVSEASYQLVRNQDERIPQVVVIVIPDGTAEQISQGLPGPKLPEMKFVEDDQIVVVNQDQVSHQLGPLWIPPATSSTMTLDRPSQYNLSCTFQPSESIGIDVLPRAKSSDRVVGILAVGLPTWALLAVYAMVATPLPKGKDGAIKDNTD
jgi:hypothetical protein